VAVAGDRLPDLHAAAVEARPAPLVRVAVPVADHHVHQARLEEGGRVHAVVGLLLQLVQEVLRSLDPLRIGEGDAAVIVVHRPLFHLAQPARELLAVLAQERVVGHDVQARHHVHHPRRAQERRDDEGRGGLLGRRLVLGDVLDERLLEVLGDGAAGVLVDGAEDVLAPVAPLEAERLGGQAAALLQHREPAAV
ncbi:MAG: hypothetical protein AVDCRST_MAG89-4157, partial [uncultured Gemmatimonadetes bacterium]